MGTNYYWDEREPEPCKTCGQVVEKPYLHIGKSSVGWVFALCVHPDRGLNTLEDWKRLWCEGEGQIRDERGKRVSADKMLSIITERSRSSGTSLRKGPYDANYRRPGEGTWDYCHYVFS